MTRADIVNIVSDKTGLTKVETEAVIKGFIECLKQSLAEGKRIEFRGFGSFFIKIRRAKKARNPGTGEIVDLPERHIPSFKPSKLFIKDINSRR